MRLLLFLLTFLLFSTILYADESEMYIPWNKYTNEVGKILNHPRKIDPKHNPADRPLKDPWDEIWKTPKRGRK